MERAADNLQQKMSGTTRTVKSVDNQIKIMTTESVQRSTGRTSMNTIPNWIDWSVMGLMWFIGVMLLIGFIAMMKAR